MDRRKGVDSGPLRILVVENESSQRLVLQSILETEWALEIVGTVELARERLLMSSFDLFVLDIRLPDGNGLKLAQYIRSLKSYKFTPIVFLTNRKEQRTVAPEFQVDGESYVSKPIDPRALRSHINERLEKARGTSEKTAA